MQLREGTEKPEGQTLPVRGFLFACTEKSESESLDGLGQAVRKLVIKK